MALKGKEGAFRAGVREGAYLNSIIELTELFRSSDSSPMKRLEFDFEEKSASVWFEDGIEMWFELSDDFRWKVVGDGFVKQG